MRRTVRFSLLNIIAVLLIWRTNYSTSAFVTNTIFPSSVYLGLFVIWIFAAASHDGLFLNDLLRKSWALLVFIAINLLLNLLLLGTIEQITINYIIVFMMFSLFVYYSNNVDSTFMNSAAIILLIDNIIKVVYSIGKLAENPAIVKQMSVAEASSLSEHTTLIADYSTVYMLVILLLFFVANLKCLKNKKIRLLVIASIVIYTIFLLECSFFFALLLMGLGLLEILFVKRKWLYFALPLFGLLVILIFRVQLGTLFASVSGWAFWSEIMKGKWNDFSNLLLYGFENAYMSGMRFDLIMVSIDTFLSYPIFGVHSLNIAGAKVGNHCGWMDGLANFGVFRYTFFISFLISAFKQVDSFCNNKGTLVAMSLFVVLGFINPNSFPQMWVSMFVLIPFISHIMDEQREIQERM